MAGWSSALRRRRHCRWSCHGPRCWRSLTTRALAALTLGVLAVLLAICSEADAFVAASLRQFSLSARLVFLIVGPAVDVKLAAMQSGVFGRQFALRSRR